MTTIRIDDIPALDHDEAMKLAATEYDRVAALLAELDDTAWAAPTECPGWTVAEVVAHLVGMMERNASAEEEQRQNAAAGARMQADGGYFIDALTATQVDERRGLSPSQLVAAFRGAAPGALAGRRDRTAEERSVTMTAGPPFAGDWTIGYLVDKIHTRDPWMHRIDMCRATGRPPQLSADHDGRIVADVVAEWAANHGEAFELVLTGPAGGAFAHGDGGERIEIDAVEFCRVLSGRVEGTGLLKTDVAF